MRRLLALALALGTMAVISCAQGTSDGPSGNHPDAHVGTNQPDAFVGTNQPDAFVSTPDAFQPADANISTPDAGSGTGTGSGFCNSDNDCDVANGQCCFTLGSPPGVCIPLDSSGLCLPF